MCEEYEIDYDLTCPKCGHSPLHSRECMNWCEDGFFDENDDDPINFAPGEAYRQCQECRGTGIERWCPFCGVNLLGMAIFTDNELYEEDQK